MVTPIQNSDAVVLLAPARLVPDVGAEITTSIDVLLAARRRHIAFLMQQAIGPQPGPGAKVARRPPRPILRHTARLGRQEALLVPSKTNMPDAFAGRLYKDASPVLLAASPQVAVPLFPLGPLKGLGLA